MQPWAVFFESLNPQTAGPSVDGSLVFRGFEKAYTARGGTVFFIFAGIVPPEKFLEPL
jgi:hypothetical protein